MGCCHEASLSPLVNCGSNRSVAVLSLDGFGMNGTLPSSLGNLKELTIFGLGQNPGLHGELPASMTNMNHLLWMSLQGTNIQACLLESIKDGLATSCTLPSFLTFGPLILLNSQLSCPSLQLNSFSSFTVNLPRNLVSTVTTPFPPSVPLGSLISGPSISSFFNCSCSGNTQISANGGLLPICTPSSSPSDVNNGKWILAIVLVGVLPLLIVGLGTYLFLK